MPYGVRIKNGRQITTIDEETDVFAVRDNFSTHQQMPYLQDEFWGFQMQSNIAEIEIRGQGTYNHAEYMKPVSTFEARTASSDVVAMRRRSITSTANMGASGTGEWGMRIWASNPRRLAFDSGHKLFQPRVYRALKYNSLIQISNGEWMFPLMVTSTISLINKLTLVRENVNTFRLVNSFDDPTVLPNVALTMFVMPNL